MENLEEKIIKTILEKKVDSPFKLNELKREFAEKHGTGFISNPSLLNSYRHLVEQKKIEQNKNLENLLQINKIRTLSGVAVVAVLTKPAGCPGKCIYCPTEKNLPKSYLPKEPAVMRAVLNDFDPFGQVRTRLASLRATGHETDKIELIVIGGTFSSLPKDYRTWFIARCFEAANDKTKTKNPKQGYGIKELINAQRSNEKAKHRIVGITVETRPDHIDEKEIKFLRQLGVTRIELGVQSIYDDVLELTRRGHLVKETINATKLLKDAGFKIGYHMMPDLPGSTPTKDIGMFEELFKDQNFQPDLLKIYPTVVTKNTALYRWWQEKKFTPYNDKTLVDTLLAIKKTIPAYVRISRLIRDIPAGDIIAGSKISNLRQTLDSESKKQGWGCRCIRCREIKNYSAETDKIELCDIRRIDYNASGGKEIFLSFEDLKNDKLLALLRLRIPSWYYTKKDTKRTPAKKLLFPSLKNAAIIREVHTYGRLVPVSGKIIGASQHYGFGRRLIEEAERIAIQEFGIKKIAVISGIGVRGYYRKFGYRLRNGYMIKDIHLK